MEWKSQDWRRKRKGKASRTSLGSQYETEKSFRTELSSNGRDSRRMGSLEPAGKKQFIVGLQLVLAASKIRIYYADHKAEDPTAGF